MEPRANYALIGAVVIAAALGLLGFIMWAGQAQFRAALDEYEIVFPGPVTLDEGAAVRYIGIKVGEVRWVRIDRGDPSKVRARIRIDSKTPVKTDSTATIDFVGVTGVTFVQINAGSPTARDLKAASDDPVPEIAAERTQLAELVTSGQRLVARSDETLAQLNKLLSDENIARFEATLANIQTATDAMTREDGLIAEVTEAAATLNDAAERFGRASDEVAAFSETANREVAALGDQVDALSGDVRGALRAVEGASRESRTFFASGTDWMQGAAADLPAEVQRTLQDLRRLMARGQDTLRDLSDRPRSVVLGDPLPYEEAQ